VYEESHHTEESEHYYESEESYHYESEESDHHDYYEPEPVHVDELIDVPEPVVDEPVHVEPVVEEPVVVHEPSYHSESEDSYISYESESSESSYYRHYSESTESHGHHHGHDDHHHNDYEEVEPYKPSTTYYQPAQEAPTQYSASNVYEGADLPDNVSINVGGDSDSDSDNDIVINIFNGVGAAPVGKKLEYGCVAGQGQCRPQCPEARYNAEDGSVTVNWTGDSKGCEHSYKPEKTTITLFAPST
jgi:hypothetical protein